MQTSFKLQHPPSANLPSKPVYSYQTQPPHCRASRSSRRRHDENQRPHWKEPRGFQYHQAKSLHPRAMSSLPYNLLAIPPCPPHQPIFKLGAPLAPKLPSSAPSKVKHPASLAPPSRELLLKPHIPVQSFSPPPLVPPTLSPHSSSGGLSSTMTLHQLDESLISTIRRKQAVERVRKAVSCAVLRKMSTEASHQRLNAPHPSINHNTQNQPSTDWALSSQKHSPELPSPAFSPRHYIPKPLLLPSKLARNSNARSPPRPKVILSSQQRPLSYRFSTHNIDSCAIQSHGNSLEKENCLEKMNAEKFQILEVLPPSADKDILEPSDEPGKEEVTTYDSSIDSERKPVITLQQSQSFPPDRVSNKSITIPAQEILSESDQQQHSTLSHFGGKQAFINKKSRNTGTVPPNRKSFFCRVGTRSLEDLLGSLKSQAFSPLETSQDMTLSIQNYLEGPPIFILPSQVTRTEVYENIRNLASPSFALWRPLLRRIASFSFAQAS
ncbi:hypothetical protein O181_074391 [Austropuccinia psidii MF-1]|uniref:Uncharacterized protein n=1 Tax=Austropuccinia psidii MF-1 TaxID=1389203 RepID=A0A9Q3F6H2_9BASI|nr:hypothetical protein [Austropuccinia psidii MF-1]